MRRVRLSTVLPATISIALICGYLAIGGDLNPPAGPIAPTMKTLVDVEPRIAVNSANTPGDANSTFRIAQSGSYYLTGNVTGESGKAGIEIAASDVTLDLGGHALIGVGGSLSGISAPASFARIVVRNGTLRGWGEMGVSLFGDNSVIDGVIASGNGTTGLLADGAGSRIHDCTASSNGGRGIQTRNGGIVEGCVARSNTGDGIFAGGPNQNVSILNCESSANGGDGIEVGNATQVRGNHCGQNGFGAEDGANIHVTGNNNRIESNTCIGADRGLDIDSGDNYVADNVVRGSADNYDIVAGNQLNLLLCQIPESIDWPASVKLAGSLTGIAVNNGITLNSSDITIDLAGHALVGVANSLHGISSNGNFENIAIVNGAIHSWDGCGIELQTFGGINCRVADLIARENGNAGIRLSQGNTVTNCSAFANHGPGIACSESCTVLNCVAYENNFGGIIVTSGCTVVNCSSSRNDEDGIGGSNCVVLNCSSYNNTGSGINAGIGSTISNCTANGNENDGIRCFSDCALRDNVCRGNGLDIGAGIHATGNGSRIEGNHCTGADRGIDVDGTDNVIVQNTAASNTINFEIAVGNAVGQILAPTTNLTAISGNAYSGGIGTSNPWANFAY